MYSQPMYYVYRANLNYLALTYLDMALLWEPANERILLWAAMVFGALDPLSEAVPFTQSYQVAVLPGLLECYGRFSG